MNMLSDVKNKTLGIITDHPYIAFAIALVAIIVVIVLIASALGYSPKQTVSNMISGRKRGDINEQELDELIDSINKKQKQNCQKAQVASR